MAKNTGKVKKDYVYVVLQEHYHFPPNESDMVAATPLFVVADTVEDADFARIEAHRRAREHAEKFGVTDDSETTGFRSVVKEHRSHSEYRVWVDSTNPNCDKFVWVVRRTEFRK